MHFIAIFPAIIIKTTLNKLHLGPDHSFSCGKLLAFSPVPDWPHDIYKL